MWFARLFSIVMLLATTAWFWVLFTAIIPSDPSDSQGLMLVVILSIFVSVPAFIAGLGGLFASFGMVRDGGFYRVKNNWYGRLIVKDMPKNDLGFLQIAFHCGCTIILGLIMTIAGCAALSALVAAMYLYGAIYVLAIVIGFIVVLAALILLMLGVIYGLFTLAKIINSAMAIKNFDE